MGTWILRQFCLVILPSSSNASAFAVLICLCFLQALARCEDDRFELDMLIEHAAAAARAAAAFLATRGGEDDSDAATPPASDAPPSVSEKPATRERNSEKSGVEKAADKTSTSEKVDKCGAESSGGGGSSGDFVLRASHARVVRLIYGENSGEVREGGGMGGGIGFERCTRTNLEYLDKGKSWCCRPIIDSECLHYFTPRLFFYINSADHMHCLHMRITL